MHDEMLEEDLKTTSAQVSATAELVDALEAEKRDLDPTDPRLVEISDRVELLAASLRRQTAIEGGLTRELHESATSEAGPAV